MARRTGGFWKAQVFAPATHAHARRASPLRPHSLEETCCSCRLPRSPTPGAAPPAAARRVCSAVEPCARSPLPRPLRRRPPRLRPADGGVGRPAHRGAPPPPPPRPGRRLLTALSPAAGPPPPRAHPLGTPTPAPQVAALSAANGGDVDASKPYAELWCGPPLAARASRCGVLRRPPLARPAARRRLDRRRRRPDRRRAR